MDALFIFVYFYFVSRFSKRIVLAILSSINAFLSTFILIVCLSPLKFKIEISIL